MRTVQVLGTGCPRCTRLAANAELALREEAIEGQVVKVGEIAEMLAFDGVSALPALAVDGQVHSCGRVLSVRQIREIPRSSSSPHQSGLDYRLSSIYDKNVGSDR